MVNGDVCFRSILEDLCLGSSTSKASSQLILFFFLMEKEMGGKRLGIKSVIAVTVGQLCLYAIGRKGTHFKKSLKPMKVKKQVLFVQLLQVRVNNIQVETRDPTEFHYLPEKFFTQGWGWWVFLCCCCSQNFRRI